MISKSLSLIPIVLFAALLSACGTTAPTSFYTLSPQSAANTAANPQSNRCIIDIGPVEIAPYLDRNQIVTRSSATRLSLTDIDHWAAPLDDTIANVLAVNLARLLPGTQPIVQSWPDANIQYKLLIKVLQFDSNASGDVHFKANWAIQAGRELDLKQVYYADIEQAGIGTSYELITQNMSTALATFSTQVASELQQLMQ